LLLSVGFSFFHNEGETLGAKLRNVCRLWQTWGIQSKGVKVELGFTSKEIELKWRIKVLTENIEFLARHDLDTQKTFIELAQLQTELIELLGGGQADYK